MSRPRNSLLRLVARATALATKERRAATRCAVHFQCSVSTFTARALEVRRFSCYTNDSQRLAQITWDGSPKPESRLCVKECNGYKWTDEYSWMDPANIPTVRTGNITDASHAQTSCYGNGPCSTRMPRHLRREDSHTDRVLAAVGAQSLQTQLLTELHEHYLAPGLDIPPERLGPYFYYMLSDDADGSLRAYLRRPAGPLDTHQQQTGLAETGRHPAAIGAGAEVLLDGGMVEADARRAEALIGRRLGRSPGALKLCPAHRLLAYSLPLADCHDQYCVLVRDTATGVLLLPGGVVRGVAGPAGMELAADGSSLLVAAADQHGRPNKVVLHDLTCASRPRQLLAETDSRFFLAVGRTKDGAFLLLNSNSKTSSEVHLLDAYRPWSAAPRLVQRRLPGLQYFVEHNHHNHQLPESYQVLASSSDSEGAGARLIILTNARSSMVCGHRGGGSGGGNGVAGGDEGGADELRVVTAPVDSPGLDSWQPLLGERPGVAVTDMDVFDDCCVLYERRNGLPAVSVVQLSPATTACGEVTGTGGGGAGQEPRYGAVVRQVPLPPWALHLAPGINADPAATTLRFTLSSPLHPPATFDLHLRTLHLQLLARETPPAPAAEVLARCSLLRVRLPLPVVPAAISAGADSSGGGSCGGGDSGSSGSEGGGGGHQVVGSNYVPPPLWMTLVLPPDVPLPPGVASAIPSSETAAAAAHCPSATSAWVTEPGGQPAAPAAVGGARGSAGVLSSSATGEQGITWTLVSGPEWDSSELRCSILASQNPSAIAGAAAAAAPRGPQEGVGKGVSTATDDKPHMNTGAALSCSWMGRPGPRPVLLSVYGAYGMPLELSYDASLLCLLERGWAVARVHVRGGGEQGQRWHAAGRRRHKSAGAADCLAAARELVAAGVTAPGLLAGHAISAGGVVLGAALNADPRVWGAAVLRCAFLELQGPCSDPTQPLAVHEWDEWGDPADPQDWAAITAVCPYGNLATAESVASADGGWRAAVLASCAEEDPRVHPGIPAKWVAQLRTALRRRRYQQLATTTTSTATVGSDDLGGSPVADAHKGPFTNAAGIGGSKGGTQEDESAADADEEDEERAHDHSRSRWGHYLSRLWGRESLPRRRREPTTPLAAAADKDDVDCVGDGFARGDGGSCTGDGGAAGAVWCPLLRVYGDGTGHVRFGTAAVEEVTEEMAFVLIALQPRPQPQPQALAGAQPNPQA